jgi:hypothetical protein
MARSALCRGRLGRIAKDDKSEIPRRWPSWTGGGRSVVYTAESMSVDCLPRPSKQVVQVSAAELARSKTCSGNNHGWFDNVSWSAFERRTSGTRKHPTSAGTPTPLSADLK